MNLDNIDMSLWKPRASSLGYYNQCLYRAAFDCAVKLGLMKLPQEVEEKEAAPKPAADLGTCIHWYLQAGLNCVFPSDAIEHKFTEEQLLVASSKFDSREDTLAHIDAVARLAAGAMEPTGPDGKPWLAEPHFTSDWLSGHIDFLSQDYTELIDLKTTGKKPRYNRIKPEHLGQQMGYCHLVKRNTGVLPKTVRVFYVDSGGKWTMMSEPVDMTTDAMQRYFKQIEELLALINNVPLLFTTAFPQLGGHCYDGFCPYTGPCRDCIIPPAATPKEAAPPASDFVFGA